MGAFSSTFLSGATAASAAFTNTASGASGLQVLGSMTLPSASWHQVSGGSVSMNFPSQQAR